MSSRKTVMSMSSEKREINPYALEREVPPLNSSLGPPACSPLKRASSVQQTQKSFSMFCWTVPSRLPAPTNKSRRSFTEAARTVAYPGIIAVLWGEPSDHRRLDAVGHHDDRRVGRHDRSADDWVVGLSCSLHSFGVSLPSVCFEIGPHPRCGGDCARGFASTRGAREDLGAGHRGLPNHELDLAAQRQGARGFDPCREAAGRATNRAPAQRAWRGAPPSAGGWAPHAET